MAVIVLIVVAIGAGLLIRNNVEARHPVDAGGLNAELPAGWIVLPAAGDRLLTAYDPLDPDTRYGVAAVDATAGATLTPEDAAARRIADRSNLLEAFAVTSEGPGTLGSVPTYEVRYSFVDQAPGRRGDLDRGDRALLPRRRALPGGPRARGHRRGHARHARGGAAGLRTLRAPDRAGRTGTAAAPRPSSASGGGPQLASIGDPTEGRRARRPPRPISSTPRSRS